MAAGNRGQKENKVPAFYTGQISTIGLNYTSRLTLNNSEVQVRLADMVRVANSWFYHGLFLTQISRCSVSVRPQADYL